VQYFDLLFIGEKILPHWEQDFPPFDVNSLLWIGKNLIYLQPVIP
jgi:hypothetical protein